MQSFEQNFVGQNDKNSFNRKKHCVWESCNFAFVVKISHTLDFHFKKGKLRRYENISHYFYAIRKLVLIWKSSIYHQTTNLEPSSR